jgi:hypothetical protein
MSNVSNVYWGQTNDLSDSDIKNGGCQTSNPYPDIILPIINTECSCVIVGDILRCTDSNWVSWWSVSRTWIVNVPLLIQPINDCTASNFITCWSARMPCSLLPIWSRREQYILSRMIHIPEYVYGVVLHSAADFQDFVFRGVPHVITVLDLNSQTIITTWCQLVYSFQS